MKNLKELQYQLDSCLPKDAVDYVLNGSQLNRWLKFGVKEKQKRIVKVLRCVANLKYVK